MRGSRVAGLLTALAAFAAPLPALATTSSTIAVTDVQITGGANPILVLSGSYTNRGITPATATLTLVTTGPLPTRTALDELLRDAATPAVRSLPVTADVTAVPPGTTLPWTITTPMAPWASQWSGVVGIGAQSGDQMSLTAVPWFPTPASDPTRLTVAVRLSVATADPYADTVDLAAATTEVDRLERLVGAGFGQLVVDPQVAVWLGSLSDTPLAQRAATLQARIASSTPSVYADARLDRLVAGRRIDLVDAITDQSASWYFPSAVSPELVNALGDRVIAVVGNDQVAQSARETTNALGRVDGQTVLVADRGAENCLTLASSSAASLCFAATVAMTTAESPNRARQLLVVTPRDWAPDDLLLTRLATVFTGATYAATGSVIGATTVGADLRLRAANTQVSGYSERTLASTAELLATAAQVGSLFPDTTQDSYLRNLAIGALSQPVSRSQAADLLRRGLDQGRLLTSSIAIETSGRFTVPGNTVELPFTVVNDSELSVTVGIKLVADNPTRLRADPVPVVTVESGQRVVVQLPISITGVGTVTAAAQIVTADGITVGAPVRISVTSTAGQRFARNLVWLAFATLVLLAANSWRKRREAP